MTTQAERGERFLALHRRGTTFVIPNPWDVGSALLLQGLGFEALATTSSGFANSLGRPDGGVSRQEKIDHCRALCAAVDLPVSADLENGFGREPEVVAETIRLVAAAGVVGGSIEDYSGDDADPIYPLDLAVERIQAAVEAVRSLDFPFTLTARAENLLHSRTDLDDTIRRLQAYAEAGAHVLYAPGLTTLEQVRTVVAALDRPVNVLAPLIRGVTVAQLADAGVVRISIGGALARAAMGAVVSAGREMRDRGQFTWLDDAVSGAEFARLSGLTP